VGILVGLPVFVAGLWWLLDSIFQGVPPLGFLLVAQFLVSVFVVYLLRSRIAERIPSAREEKLIDLLGAQEKFLSLYEHSPVPYITLDQAGKIVMYNLATVRLFHTTTAELIGQSFAAYLLHEDPETVRALRRSVQAGRVVNDTEIQIQLDDGSTRWVLASIFVYRKANQRLVSLVDITHQKQVDIAKSEFVALATHQLRTPISAIRWNVELLQKNIQDILNEKQAKYLTKIDDNVQRMVALINDFLNVSKLEMGTFATTEEQINLTEFCNEVIEEFKERIETKQIEVLRNYQPESLSFTTDPRLLHIMVSNLVSNAVKYVTEGGQVYVQYQLLEGRLQIEIRDTGIGIPVQEQPDLFTKFFRAGNAQTHHTEGTGLGLYVVKQSVEKLGGSITYTSAENEGTVFTIDLPYRA
jgi:PAS domain S-box-containing protein